MKVNALLSVLSIAASASMLTACASSTVRRPTPMASLPPHLLVAPEALPRVERSGAGDAATMTGAQCHASLIELYGVAGSIRARLIELQEAERMRSADDGKEKK